MSWALLNNSGRYLINALYQDIQWSLTVSEFVILSKKNKNHPDSAHKYYLIFLDFLLFLSFAFSFFWLKIALSLVDFLSSFLSGLFLALLEIILNMIRSLNFLVILHSRFFLSFKFPCRRLPSKMVVLKLSLLQGCSLFEVFNYGTFSILTFKYW